MTHQKNIFFPFFPPPQIGTNQYPLFIYRQNFSAHTLFTWKVLINSGHLLLLKALFFLEKIFLLWFLQSELVQKKNYFYYYYYQFQKPAAMHQIVFFKVFSFTPTNILKNIRLYTPIILIEKCTPLGVQRSKFLHQQKPVKLLL